MARYRIASVDGQGAITGLLTQEEFEAGPPAGSTIPADQGNRHWRQYLAWLAQGNEPDPME